MAPISFTFKPRKAQNPSNNIVAMLPMTSQLLSNLREIEFSLHIGSLYGLELYGMLFNKERNPDNMRTYIINRFRETLPDYATDIVSEGISVVLFQLLTTTNQLVVCDGGKALADVLNSTTFHVNG